MLPQKNAEQDPEKTATVQCMCTLFTLDTGVEIIYFDQQHVSLLVAPKRLKTSVHQNHI